YTSRFFYRLSGALRVLHSFPTRRSSDLPFQRRINKQITAQRDPTQQTGQQVDRNGQMNQAGGRTQAAKDENGVRAQPPRRQRPILRATHERVILSFHQLIQRRRAARQESCAQQRVKQQEVVQRAVK